MITATLTPDKARWSYEVHARFDRFERRLAGGITNRVPEIRQQVAPVIKAKRVRPEDKTTRTPLTPAIEQSIAGVGLGIGVGDPDVLRVLAPHWHAIEVGSSHIVGMEFWGFTGPAGTFLPDRSRSRSERRRATYAEVRASGLNPGKKSIVKNPIRPHKYLDTLGQITRRVVRDELHKRATEAFGGANYKTQTKNAGA